MKDFCSWLVKEQDEDDIGIVTFTTPLFIRLLEFAREDAKGDLILHDIAENATILMKDNEFLDMGHYAKLVKSKNS